MEKELKSCTGVLLRADLTGHGHLPCFGRRGLNGRALLGQPSKGHLCRILISFSIMFYYIKKLETYFALFIFQDFRTVCQDHNSKTRYVLSKLFICQSLLTVPILVKTFWLYYWLFRKSLLFKLLSKNFDRFFYTAVLSFNLFFPLLVIHKVKAVRFEKFKTT